VAADPTEPAAPAPPRLPPLTATWDPAGLDERYPDVDGVDLVDQVVALDEARTFDLLRSRLRGGAVSVPEGCPIELLDCELEGVDLAGARISRATRVVLRGCRLTGADLGDAALTDVEVDDCALDLASLRLARLERVVLRGGRVDGLDASGARLTDVVVAGLALGDVAIGGARLVRVDVSGADLGGVAALADLAGATIDASQAIALAARLAHGLGIAVRDRAVAFPGGDTQQ